CLLALLSLSDFYHFVFPLLAITLLLIPFQHPFTHTHSHTHTHTHTHSHTHHHNTHTHTHTHTPTHTHTHTHNPHCHHQLYPQAGQLSACQCLIIVPSLPPSLSLSLSV